MQALRTITLAALIFGLVAACRADASLQVTSWSLQRLVGDFAANPPRVAGINHIDVQNPYQTSVSYTHINSHAAVDYDYLWNENSGQFNVIADLSAQGTLYYVSNTVNEIRFDLTTPMVLSAVGQFHYDLPTEPNRLAGILAKIESTDSTISFAQGLSIDTSQGDPEVGTFNLNFSQVLPAGQSYRLTASFGLASNPHGTTALGFANGFINFSLTPVPEPGSLSLLAIGGIATIRRRLHS